jgi:hypothetical protein
MDQTASPRRRFTLRDITVLIPSIAVGCWLARTFVLNAPRIFGPDYAIEWVGWVNLSLMVLMTTQLGLLLLALMPPRPRRRRLARQPGFMAGVAVASVVVAQTVQDLSRFERNGAIWLNNYLLSISGSGRMAPSILLLWFVGSLQGLDWRRPGWPELLGRLLGVIWVFVWVFFLVRHFVA